MNQINIQYSQNIRMTTYEFEWRGECYENSHILSISDVKTDILTIFCQTRQRGHDLRELFGLKALRSPPRKKKKNIHRVRTLGVALTPEWEPIKDKRTNDLLKQDQDILLIKGNLTTTQWKRSVSLQVPCWEPAPRSQPGSRAHQQVQWYTLLTVVQEMVVEAFNSPLILLILTS